MNLLTLLVVLGELIAEKNKNARLIMSRHVSSHREISKEKIAFRLSQYSSRLNVRVSEKSVQRKWKI
jgi:hypothetical protein